jgi:hypothetical protein
MGRTCSTHRLKEKFMKLWTETSREEAMCVCGRIILKSALDKISYEELDSSYSGKALMAVFCEYDNESLGSVKGRSLLTRPVTTNFSRMTLYCGVI